MVQAIGTTSSVSALSPGATVAGLEARLAQYQKQLSDCVNCDSSKTLKGKEEISEISGKINALRERIDRISGNAVKPAATAAAAEPLTTTTSSEVPRPSSDSSLGSLVNLFA